MLLPSQFTWPWSQRSSTPPFQPSTIFREDYDLLQWIRLRPTTIDLVNGPDARREQLLILHIAKALKPSQSCAHLNHYPPPHHRRHPGPLLDRSPCRQGHLVATRIAPSPQQTLLPFLFCERRRVLALPSLFDYRRAQPEPEFTS